MRTLYMTSGVVVATLIIVLTVTYMHCTASADVKLSDPDAITPAPGIVTLPLGDWSINANGSSGLLRISTFNYFGNFQGTVFGDPTTNFSFNFGSNNITFTRILNSSTYQVYSGHLSIFRQVTSEGIGELFILSGSFTQFPSSNTFPWSASTSVFLPAHPVPKPPYHL
jgi:hypothetical protein